LNHTDHALEVIRLETLAVQNLKNQLTNDFNLAIEAILSTTGRTIICGMGKSGIIGKKIAATLASTGTPSFSIHPGEAFHGDLGMLTSTDVFIAISNSGETDEVVKLLPFLKKNGNTIISLTGNPNSTLATSSHYHLNTSVPEEACPLKLAPTSSTTATLVMGDAIAVSLMHARGFKPENFAILHPGGSLGRRLLNTVDGEMVKKELPTITADSEMIDLISAITKGQLGLAIVIENPNNRILGVITDGDLRRAINRNTASFFKLRARDIMTDTPAKTHPNIAMCNAFDLMENNNINSLLVEDNGILVGVLKK